MLIDFVYDLLELRPGQNSAHLIIVNTVGDEDEDVGGNCPDSIDGLFVIGMPQLAYYLVELVF